VLSKKVKNDIKKKIKICYNAVLQFEFKSNIILGQVGITNNTKYFYFFVYQFYNVKT